MLTPGLIQKRFIEICLSRDYKAAVKFQNELKELLPGKPYNGKIKTVCGLDISYNKFSPKIYVAAAVFSFPDLILLEEATLASSTDFPYIPGLLAYREGPPVLELISKLKTPIDILIFDGQGIAHPRGAGVASIVGLLLNKPSIGSAKTKLVGLYEKPGTMKGATSDLIYKDKIVGKVLRSRNSVSPIFVSVGYRIELDRAVELVLEMCRGPRIPLPIRQAHHLANLARQEDS